MIFDIEKLICSNFFKDTYRKKDFYCCKVILSPKSNAYDRFILNQLKEKGEELAKKVNPGAANDSSLKRDYDRILINSKAGLIAEYLWKSYLNLTCIDTIVIETEMEDASRQIDLKTIKDNCSIEVRSSFPRNGFQFAICHPQYQFDIIGPYSNGYKPGEIQKHYYARALFPFEMNQFDNYIDNDEFTVYLTGGATWDMFQDDTITIKKSFIPEDEITIDRLNSKSDYLVIPFCHALDSIELYNKIKQ